MSDDKEWSQERRELIELVDDIARRLRTGCPGYEAVMLLENAAEEAENLPD